MTAVQVGNYGINEEDVESDGPKLSGLIVRELSQLSVMESKTIVIRLP